MDKFSEKDLDKIIDLEFKNSKSFVSWFLGHTKFANQGGNYFWSRSDHPWGRIPISVLNKETGKEEIVVKESETDILVVFTDSEENKFALHIENKVSGGKFTQLQPELYKARSEIWKNDPKYKGYKDYETVLIAPMEFYRCNEIDCKKFDKFISHEKIAEHISEFKPS